MNLLHSLKGWPQLSKEQLKELQLKHMDSTLNFMPWVSPTAGFHWGLKLTEQLGTRILPLTSGVRTGMAASYSILTPQQCGQELGCVLEVLGLGYKMVWSESGFPEEKHIIFCTKEYFPLVSWYLTAWQARALLHIKSQMRREHLRSTFKDKNNYASRASVLGTALSCVFYHQVFQVSVFQGPRILHSSCYQ